MNVLFLTLSRFTDVNRRGIYSDLMRHFRDAGHHVYVVYASERRFGTPTRLEEQDGITLLSVRTLNIQKTNVVEKGIGTLLLESQYKRAIKRHLAHVRFDLLLYSTPPITITGVLRYLKRRNPRAVTYLLLKDIFPQNAVDLGMFPEGGLLHKYFRRREQLLYRLSDYIGCMSPANVAFVRRYNPWYPSDRVELAPNSLAPRAAVQVDRRAVREKYGLPADRPVFLYGGNLGRPQGIDYLIRCLDANKSRKDCFFLVVGSGTEYGKLRAWYERQDKEMVSVALLQGLPAEEYDRLVGSCDVGMIFLDCRFLIPNYPSRLLSYMEHGLPVLCATDRHTDIGSIAKAHGYGFWCESVHVSSFTALVDKFLSPSTDLAKMGENAYKYFSEHYLVSHTYRAICKHLDRA